MSVSQMLQIFSALPQLLEGMKKMGPEEKRRFVEQLGLTGEDQEAAVNLLTAFQEGQQVTPEEQVKAQRLLEKCLKMNNMDLNSVLQMMSAVK